MSISIDRGLVIEALQHAGVEDHRIRGDYSGRAMFGARCFGVDFDHLRDAFAFAVALGAVCGAADVDYGPLLDRVATDDMGRGMILYFPGVTLDGDEATEATEDDAA